MGEISIPAGQTSSSLNFDLPAEVHGSWVSMQFRLLPALQRAVLVAPDGQQRDVTSSLRRLPASQARSPELGDLHIAGELMRDPAPGRWQLLLRHTPLVRRSGISWQVVLHPRFAGVLSVVGGETLRTSVEADVLLNLTDYGMPANGTDPGSLSLVAADGRRSTYAFKPGNSPGRFETRITVQVAGRLDAFAAPVFTMPQGAAVRLELRRSWVVEAGQPASSQPLQIAVERGPGNCLAAVRFDYAWQADSAGVYVLSVLLGSVRITGSNEVLAAGPVTLSAVLRGSRFSGIGPVQVQQADVLDVVKSVGGGVLLLRRSAVALSMPFNPGEACR